MDSKEKIYAQWIISDNGVPVDKLDVKGLDVKQVVFLDIQEIMSDVLISILRGETEEQISDKVLKFKKLMVELDIKDIVKEFTVKNITKYLPKKGKRQLFSIMKGTRIHVNNNHVQRLFETL